MRGLTLALLAVGLVLGCGDTTEDEAAGPPPLETVDVGGGFDEGISLEGDVKGRPSEEFSAGVVPSDYPPTFPIYRPSTVVDFGPGFVEFTAAASPAAVRSSLARRAEAAGWVPEGDGFRKGERSVTLAVSADGALARIRVDYR